MFRNIGKKVKVLAWIFFVLGLVLTVLVAACFVLIAVKPEMAQILNTVFKTAPFNNLSNISLASGIISAVIVLIAGFLISWVGNWALYAIGEAADNKGQIDYLLLVLDERKARSTTPKQ